VNNEHVNAFVHVHYNSNEAAMKQQCSSNAAAMKQQCSSNAAAMQQQ